MFIQFLVNLFALLLCFSPLLIGLLIMDKGYSYSLRMDEEDKEYWRKERRLIHIQLYFFVCSLFSVFSLMY